MHLPRTVVAPCAAALLTLLAPDLSAGGPKPRVVVLATGGTIAGAGASRVDGRYDAAKKPVEQLLTAVPELRDVAQVRGEQVAQLASQAMTDEVWLQIARRVNALCRRSDVDGVVITHGTDTLEETAYLLHLVVDSAKPVVLVAAMRPPTSISPDGPMNLFNAVALAASPLAKGLGVLVAMNEEIHSARDATKRHTTGIGAFTSPNTGPLGRVQGGEVLLHRRPLRRHTSGSALKLGGGAGMPRVVVLYGHANAHPELVEAAVSLGAKGIVYAGVGDGNLFPSVEAALVRARAQGVVVVRSSRVGGGRITRGAEVDDDRHGFVTADTLNPQKARVLLKLALRRSRDPKEIQRLFDTH